MGPAGGEYLADTTKIFAYLTIPEDAKHRRLRPRARATCCSASPISTTPTTPRRASATGASWRAARWNGGGDIPAHPSAWCKAQQGWVTGENVTTDGLAHDRRREGQPRRATGCGRTARQDRSTSSSRTARRAAYDANLPGDGLLVWHIDDAIADNTDEAHYQVGLVQADGKRDLELQAATAATPVIPSRGPPTIEPSPTPPRPNSKSYGGLRHLRVADDHLRPGHDRAGPGAVRQEPNEGHEGLKDGRKDIKEQQKDRSRRRTLQGPQGQGKDFKDLKEQGLKELKEGGKDFKELKEGGKDFKELKEGGKDFKELKEGGKDIKEGKERRRARRRDSGERRARAAARQLVAVVEELIARVAALEDAAERRPGTGVHRSRAPARPHRRTAVWAGRRRTRAADAAG